MNAEMRQLLAEASVVAEAGAAALEKPTSHSKPSSVTPIRSGRSTFEQMASRFLGCRTADDERKALAWARAELRNIRGFDRPKPRDPKTVVLREFAGNHYSDVSQITGTSKRTVRRWREEAGKDPTYGNKMWARRAA